MSFRLITLALILTPALAIAAPAKKGASAKVASDDTIFGSASSGGTSIPAILQNHLSVGANFNFSDSVEVSGGQKLDTDRGLVISAQYEFDQFSPGIAAQVGGTYDFSREVKNTNGLKFQDWSTYGELVGKLTPQIKVFGGVNYNFPSLSNAAEGASIKGKLSFQGGGSYQFARNFSFEGRYRMLEMDITGRNQNGGTTTTGIKSSGFMLGGRYIF